MALPNFISPQKLSDNTNTTTSQVIRVVNSLISNLSDIFVALVKQPQLSSITLPSITLQIGSNNIPHTLGKTLVGWSIVRKRSQGDIYDTQDTNSNPQTYLQLVSNAVVVVDLLVY